jgi:hypothetical protein
MRSSVLVLALGAFACGSSSDDDSGMNQSPIDSNSGEDNVAGDDDATNGDTLDPNDTESGDPSLGSSLRPACEVGEFMSEAESCAFVVGNLCFETAEQACDCDGCGLDSCTIMESFPAQVACEQEEVEIENPCEDTEQYYEPGCDEGMPEIEAGCFVPCRDDSDTSCADGASCTLVSINPCVCNDGDVCCDACGAQAFVCL